MSVPIEMRRTTEGQRRCIRIAADLAREAIALEVEADEHPASLQSPRMLQHASNIRALAIALKNAVDWEVDERG